MSELQVRQIYPNLAQVKKLGEFSADSMSGRRSLPASWQGMEQIRIYVYRQADSLGRYILEQFLQALVGWMPTFVGVGLRAILPIDWRTTRLGSLVHCGC